VIEATVATLDVAPEHMLAWLGPAIGPESFEVGGEVRDIFLADDPAAEQAFVAQANGKWLADIYRLATLRLARLGVSRVFGGGLCTFRDRERFYSYRRDGATGRMASLIWLANEKG
jgi:copper oxidase (laccase) domain-containing protein